MGDADMLDDAIRMGSQAVTQASRYMALSRTLITAINAAAKHMECGQTKSAHEILIEAKQDAARHVIVPGTDLKTKVARAIADVRERRGEPPYEKLTANASAKLHYEAQAVLEALGIKG